MIDYIRQKDTKQKKDLEVKIAAIPCEIFTRVVGYYRPVEQFHKGKKEEFKDRKDLKIDKERVKKGWEGIDKKEKK